MNPPQPDPKTARLAQTALAGIAIFALGIVLMHGLRPDYEVASHMISDYAVGPWGSVMTTAFAGASVGCLMLALGLARSRPASIAGWLVAALFAIAAIGLAVTAAAPTDLPGAPSTTTGEIHEVSFLVNVASIVLAALLTAVLTWRDARWRAHRVPALALATLLVVGVVVQFKTLHRGMPYGLANRFVVFVMVSWLVFIALRLQRLGEAGDAPSR